jgi:hypothetical protein
VNSATNKARANCITSTLRSFKSPISGAQTKLQQSITSTLRSFKSPISGAQTKLEQVLPQH